MSLKNKILYSLGILFISSCSGGDVNEDIVTPAPIDTLSVGVYVDENRWIYSQMNLHYLWNEYMPDSLSCNYLLDPVSFYKALLSPKDRFSYCEHNNNYKPNTRIGDGLWNSNSVFRDSIYYIDKQKVGYLCYLSFEDIKDLEPVFKKFYEEHITDLILDLRYNGGGLISTCQYLCSSIIPKYAYGNRMEYLRYNDIVTRKRVQMGLDSVYSYNFLEPTDRQNTLGVHLYGLQLDTLYVIVSGQTASASESTIICLKPYMEVVTIGEKTVGKGVGMETLSDSRYKYQLVPITFRYYNAIGETVPDDGLIPDYLVEGGTHVEKMKIGNLDEPLLKQAITLISK